MTKKEKYYSDSEVLMCLDIGKDVNQIKINQHRLDKSLLHLFEMIDELKHAGFLKNWVLLNVRVIEDDERLPIIFIDAVRNNDEIIENYINNTYVKSALKLSHDFYFKAMEIVNDLNNMHGDESSTLKIKKLETLFSNTFNKQ